MVLFLIFLLHRYSYRSLFPLTHINLKCQIQTEYKQMLPVRKVIFSVHCGHAAALCYQPRKEQS